MLYAANAMLLRAPGEAVAKALSSAAGTSAATAASRPAGTAHMRTSAAAAFATPLRSSARDSSIPLNAGTAHMNRSAYTGVHARSARSTVNTLAHTGGGGTRKSCNYAGTRAQRVCNGHQHIIWGV
jgi:hypothetical protein